MSFLVSPFSRSSRAGDAWFCVGPASSYPNLDDSTRIAEQRLCRDKFTPGCRIFHVPREDSSKAVEVAVDDWKHPETGDPKDQVMVFQYNQKFVAINHVRLPRAFWIYRMLQRLTLAAGMSTLVVPSLQWHTL